MRNKFVMKIALAGMFTAVAVVGSMLQFPVFGSQCAPVQHMVNVLCAVLLGPGYGVAVAFLASLLRNLFSLGSLLAFPGSMCGALLCGLAYWKTKNLPATPLRRGVRHRQSSAGCCPIPWPSPSWARWPGPSATPPMWCPS